MHIHVNHLQINCFVNSNYLRNVNISNKFKLESGEKNSQILNFICYVEMQNQNNYFLISNHRKVIEKFFCFQIDQHV